MSHPSRHLLPALLLAACGAAPADNLAPEDAAARQAAALYTSLYDGHADHFVDGHAMPTGTPAPAYRQQLCEAAQQHARATERQHRGVNAVTPVGTHTDSTLAIVEVFLQIDYADGTHEEIVVPMVADSTDAHQWKIK